MNALERKQARARLYGEFTYIQPNIDEDEPDYQNDLPSLVSPEIAYRSQTILGREDHLLADLQDFHRSAARLDALKQEFADGTSRLASRSIRTLEFAASISFYQQNLVNRADAARELLAEPIDDLDSDRRAVEERESAVHALQERDPEPPSPESLTGFIDKKQELESTVSANMVAEASLAIRHLTIESHRKLYDSDRKKFEAASEAQSAELTSTGLDGSASQGTLHQSQRKREFIARKNAIEERARALSRESDDFQSLTQVTEQNLKDREAELVRLTEERRALDDLYYSLELDKVARGRREMDKNDVDYIISGVTAQLENQNSVLARKESWAAEIQLMIEYTEATREAISQRTSELVGRRRVLPVSRSALPVIQQRFDELNRELSQAQEETAAAKAVLDEWLGKVQTLQQDVNRRKISKIALDTEEIPDSESDSDES